MWGSTVYLEGPLGDGRSSDAYCEGFLFVFFVLFFFKSIWSRNGRFEIRSMDHERPEGKSEPVLEARPRTSPTLHHFSPQIPPAAASTST